MSKALCRSPVRLPVVVLLFCLVFSFWLRFDCDFVVLVQTLAAARFGVDLIILLNRATLGLAFYLLSKLIYFFALILWDRLLKRFLRIFKAGKFVKLLGASHTIGAAAFRVGFAEIPGTLKVKHGLNWLLN